MFRHNIHWAQVALLTSLATTLHVLEAWLPPLGIPGAKLGLANLAGLVALAELGVREAFLVTALRVTLGSVIAGTFLSPGFLLSAAGGLAATAVMAVSCRWEKKAHGFDMAGVSLTGAVAHNLAQWILAYQLLGEGVLYYLPMLLLAALPAGWAVGVIAGRLTRSLARAGFNWHTRRAS